MGRERSQPRAGSLLRPQPVHREPQCWDTLQSGPCIEARNRPLCQSLGVGSPLRCITLGEVLAGHQGNSGQSAQRHFQQLRDGGIGPGEGVGVECQDAHSTREWSSLFSRKLLAAVTLRGERLRESPGSNRSEALGGAHLQGVRWVGPAAGSGGCVPWQTCLRREIREGDSLRNLARGNTKGQK